MILFLSLCYSNNILLLITMEELNEIEKILLVGLTNKYPSLLAHIPHLKVKDRKKLAFGMSIIFEYVDFDSPREDLNALFSNEENIALKNLKQGLNYVIDVTDGEITSIDFSTYDNENWNGKWDDFKLVPAEKFE